MRARAVAAPAISKIAREQKIPLLESKLSTARAIGSAKALTREVKNKFFSLFIIIKFLKNGNQDNLKHGIAF